MDPHSETPALTQADYERLLAFRTSLRRFLHLADTRAQEAGITPAQHQLLLAIRGHGEDPRPSVGDIAGYLLIRHNSAVGLIDRAEAAGLVSRQPDRDHPGTVRLGLTDAGEEKLALLSGLALAELNRLAPAVNALWKALRSDEE